MIRDVLRKAKQFLPASSRSFHETARAIQRIEENQRTIMKKVDEAAGRAEHSKIYLEQMYRQPGETPTEARLRMFAAIPEATGMSRVSQLANARMLSELDAICSKIGIDYWFSSGTLVATLYRQGFMPWDDDIDVCMMRSDIDKLAAYLEAESDEYRVAVVYDRYTMTKQIRFCSIMPNLPCFIDLAIWDWARDATKEHDDVMHRLRREFMAEVGRIGGYWDEEPYLFGPGSVWCVQCEPVDPAAQDKDKAAEVIARFELAVDKYQAEARRLGVLCDEGEAGALMYTVDDIYNAPWRRFIWEKEKIFPLKRAAYEHYEFLIPAAAEEIAEDCYPGCPYLPKDILGNEHFPPEILSNQQIRETLRNYAAGK